MADFGTKNAKKVSAAPSAFLYRNSEPSSRVPRRRNSYLRMGLGGFFRALNLGRHACICTVQDKPHESASWPHVRFKRMHVRACCKRGAFHVQRPRHACTRISACLRAKDAHTLAAAAAVIVAEMCTSIARSKEQTKKETATWQELVYAKAMHFIVNMGASV